MNADACYRALRARDSRFDGVFYVGVKTTGIYCRPICPARPARRERCEFFDRPAEAERAGFRACFRCRPELAPGSAPSDAVPRLVRSAVARIEAGFLNERSIEDLASLEGVSARHLRRAIEAELGVSPIELAQTRRVALAKQLLQDTALPLTEIAFASGFRSVRRFNRLFRDRFGRAPSSLRRGQPPASDALCIRLDYRPPFDWPAMLSFLKARAIAGVETIEDDVYERIVDGGTLRVTHDGAHLRATLPLALAPKLPHLVPRLRALFDLDAQPELIARHLRRDSTLAPLVRARPGLRVPGAFDRFELGLRAILGQQVSVRGATTLAGRFFRAFGLGQAHIARLPEERIAAIGVPRARARSIIALAQHDLDAASVESLLTLPGVGPWTAHYFAMRALAWPDAFPASDLGLRKALGVSTAKQAERRAERWQPWRAYAAMYLWSSL